MTLKSATAEFLDRAKVRAALGRAERSVLGRFGARVRLAARHSIRPRKKVSAPGSPPSSHTGVLKRFIFYCYDPIRRSVVIGPARLSEKSGEAPPLLEYGGTARRRGSRRRLVYRPRSFMGPAFEKEKPNLPALWANSVKP